MRKEDVPVLLQRQQTLTEEELQGLCEATAGSVTMSAPSLSEAVHLRASIELIRSMRQFDKASAALVETTNNLTRWVLGLTVLASLLGAGSLWLSYLALVKN